MFKRNKRSSPRRYPRIPFVATIHFTRQGSDQRSEAILRKISTHGIGMYAKEPIRKGERLLVELSLSIGENSFHESILGEVVWVAQTEEKDRRAVGISFNQMEKEQAELYSYLKRLEETVSLPEIWEESD